MRASGLNETAAQKKWQDLFTSPMTRKDQVDAVSEDGTNIGKVQSSVFSQLFQSIATIAVGDRFNEKDWAS